MLLPVVMREQGIKSFNYYQNQAIYRAIAFQNRLYKLVHTFDAEHRQRAYDIGCKLSNRGDLIVITVSDDGYKIWANLQSEAPAKPVLDLPQINPFQSQPQFQTYASAS
jgi:hypothetical protein